MRELRLGLVLLLVILGCGGGGSDPQCQDADGDGYGNPESSACRAGLQADCYDSNPTVHPGAPEVCNGVDDNCDGQIDEGFDKDGDGFTSCGGDCDDSNPAIRPGAPELCNGVDDNCNGVVDEGCDPIPRITGFSCPRYIKRGETACNDVTFTDSYADVVLLYWTSVYCPRGWVCSGTQWTIDMQGAAEGSFRLCVSCKSDWLGNPFFTHGLFLEDAVGNRSNLWQFSYSCED